MAWEPITSPTIAPPTNQWTPILPVQSGTSLTTQNFGMAQSTPQQTTLNIDPVTIAKNTAQGIARTVASVGITAANKFASAPLGKALGVVPFDQSIPTTWSPITSAVFGGQPVQTVQKNISDVQKTLEPYIGKTGSNFAATPVVLGSIALDLSGFGGGSAVKVGTDLIPEAFFKTMAETDSVDTITSLLKGTGMTDTQVAELAPKFAESKTVDEAKNVLLDFGKTASESSIPLLDQPLETPPNMPQIIPKQPLDNGIVSEIKGGLSPQTASPTAQLSADIVRGSKAEVANQSALESYKYKDVSTAFDKASPEENISNISAYEKTGQFQNAPPGYSDFFKQSMDNSRKTLQDTYGTDRVGYVENYVRRAFEFGSKADEAKGTAYLTNNVGSLSANKSVLKGRVLDMPLDEALANMRARGINVKPVTTNPELLRQWSVANAHQAETYAQTWQQLKNNKLITFAKVGENIPERLIKLDDRVAQVFYPTDKGLVKTGQYYADPNVARILNNTVSKGLGGSPTFQGLRSLSNSINQFELGLSAFHLTGTAINAGISDMALGFKNISTGNIAEGSKQVGRSLLPGTSFVRDMMKGGSFISDLTKGNPQAEAFLKDVFNPAGGRLKVDQQYINQAYSKMIDAFKQKSVWGTVKGMIKIPQAFLEKISNPLMSYAIPRVKIGAFMDIANSILEKTPNATAVELNRAYAKAWDSIDNRFGQLVYDNLFWNKTAKDLAMIATRSVGWNLGTVRELGGGITDIGTKTFKGKGVTDRTWYAIALPIYAGMIGAVYQYLHTGKKPQSLKDYYYPQNGLTDKYGNPDRVSLPTYMKDVYAYGTNPLQTIENKASPLLSMSVQLANNKDYYGDMIRNPQDPISKQLQQVGSYGITNLLPFSVTQAQQTAQNKGGFEQQVENFAGFTKAPAGITHSAQQQELQDLLTKSKGGFAPRTPEQVQAGTFHNQAEALYAELTKLPADQANAQATQLKTSNPSLFNALKSVVSDAKLGVTYDERLMKSLPVQDGTRAQYVYEQVQKLKTPEEKNSYIQNLQTKKVVTPQVFDQLKLLISKPQANAGNTVSKILGALTGAKQADAAAVPIELSNNITKTLKGIASNETKGVKNPYAFSQPSGKASLGRALGKYQITEADLKRLSQRYLGRVVSPQEFLANPKLQDTFMKNRIAYQLSQGYSPEQIADIHRSGTGGLLPPNQYKVKHPGYVKSFNEATI